MGLLNHISVDNARIASVATLAVTGFLCAKGVAMTVSAISVASVLGGIFLTLLNGAIFVSIGTISIPLFL